MNGGGDLVFIDTNVLLYTLDASNPLKRALALRWRDALWQSQTGRLSWQVLNEFYSNATRKIGAPAITIRRLVEAYTRWKPRGFSLQLTQRAWYWTDHARINYWDALILAAAERSGCRWLLSEDFTHKRKYGSVEAINPFLAEPDGYSATPAG
jgi:predicted nucleic acid-binding protein